MPSVINDSCIKCGICASICPVSAMHLADTQMVIDPEVCIDCGACIAECPQSAITLDSEASAEAVQFNAEQAKT
ncbi:MAG: 4Fe-4S binding protein, partial [Alphaproteobacteria bacterium]|nr:4Fe-4S binding protein [Alphaproteobacteria bacterium]